METDRGSSLGSALDLPDAKKRQTLTSGAHGIARNDRAMDRYLSAWVLFEAGRLSDTRKITERFVANL